MPCHISQVSAKRIYCLTQRDIGAIKLLTEKSQTRRKRLACREAACNALGRPLALTNRRSFSQSNLNEEIVMNYALVKHGGSQKGIDLAVMQRNAARIQRADAARRKQIERKARSEKVCVCVCVQEDCIGCML
jgi:hypothetical protein